MKLTQGKLGLVLIGLIIIVLLGIIIGLQLLILLSPGHTLAPTLLFSKKWLAP